MLVSRRGLLVGAGALIATPVEGAAALSAEPPFPWGIAYHVLRTRVLPDAVERGISYKLYTRRPATVRAWGTGLNEWEVFWCPQKGHLVKEWDPLQVFDGPVLGFYPLDIAQHPRAAEVYQDPAWKSTTHLRAPDPRQALYWAKWYLTESVAGVYGLTRPAGHHQYESGKIVGVHDGQGGISPLPA